MPNQCTLLLLNMYLFYFDIVAGEGLKGPCDACGVGRVGVRAELTEELFSFRPLAANRINLPPSALSTGHSARISA